MIKDWCNYIYHCEGKEMSDGYGNKIFLISYCNEKSDVVQLKSKEEYEDVRSII